MNIQTTLKDVKRFQGRAWNVSCFRAGDETVFQRLYDDGLIRVARLEKLREKVRKERSKLGYADKEEARMEK